MVSRSVWMYLKQSDQEAFNVFLTMLPSVHLQSQNGSFYKLTIEEDAIQDELMQLRELSIQDLLYDVTAFIVPSEGFPESGFIDLLPSLNPGIYALSDLIPIIVYRQNHDLKSRLKQFFKETVGSEVMSTVLGFIKADLNASKASKELYMHRNTLNYRLDHFTEKTHLDIKSFTVAFAIYLLYTS